MLTALDAAEYIISNWNAEQHAITPMKLQKLLYYLHVWSVVSGEPVLKAEFLKWKYGPVNEAVYNAYKRFGKSAIKSESSGPAVFLSPEHKVFFHFVVDNYISFSAFTLSSMTHQEQPWLATEENKVISEEAIKEYYSRQHFSKNFPVDIKNKPYYPVQTNGYYSFIFDIDDDDPVKEMLYYESYESFLELEKNTKTRIANSMQNFSAG